LKTVIVNLMKALKLDSSYRPIEIIDAREAFCLVFMGRANLVEVYDNKFIRTVYQAYAMPCVISLNRYVKVGKVTLSCNKRNVLWRDRNTCQYCGKVFKTEKLTLDHVTPRSRGGPKTWENIVTCCHKCNQKKGNKLPHESGMVPIRLPEPPSPYVFQTIGIKETHPKWFPYLRGQRIGYY